MARSAILQVVDPVEAEVPRRAQLTDRTALELFARGHERHPAGRRVLLIQRGNRSSARPMVASMALGQVD